MVTAPIAVLLYDRTFLAGSWRDAWRARRPLHLALAATWVILVRLLAGNHESAASAGFGMRDLTVGEYARSQPGVILHYLRLALWPRGLVLDYAWPVAHGAAAVAAPAFVVVALAAAAVWAFRRRPEVGFLAVAFFVTLAPSSSVVPIKDLAFEHRMYLPLAPLVALAVVGGRVLLDRTALAVGTRLRVGAALVTLVATVATALTIARNRDYATPVAMWTDVATKRPANARARNNLGDALFDEGRIEDAVVQLQTALQLDPAYADATTISGARSSRRAATKRRSRSCAKRRGSIPSPRRRKTTSALRSRDREGGSKHRRTTRRRCDSTPSTPRPTTTSGRCSSTADDTTTRSLTTARRCA
jgi:tetratricopeptide (TPR) repeat protein